MWKGLAMASLLLSRPLNNSDYIPPSSQSNLKIFSSLGSRELSNEIAGILGIHLGRLQLSKFADGESNIKIIEDVTDKVVFLVHSLGPPVNDNIIDMLLLVSALKRGGCRKVVLIIPYMGYGRQDNPVPGSLFSPAEDICRLIEAFEVDMVIGVDFHSEIDGHFQIPVEKVSPYDLAIRYLKKKSLMHPVIISPDVRGTARAYEFYKALSNVGINCSFAVLPNPGASLSYLYEMSAIVGDSLTGRDVIIVDDIVISGNSILKCVEQVRKKDAENVYCFATHPVLAGDAVRKISSSSITEYICTNSLEIREQSSKIVQISIAGAIARKIYEVFAAELG